MTRAIGLYKRVCDGKRPEGCLALGRAFERGDGVTADAGRAIMSYRKACHSGEQAAEAEGCERLGKLYEDGGSPDPKLALEALQRACVAGQQSACERVETLKEPPVLQPPVRANPGARYYVALAPRTRNPTGRPQAVVDAAVIRVLQAALVADPSVQVAPGGESDVAAKQLIEARKLKAIYLAVELGRFEYAGGLLGLEVQMAAMRYPSRTLVATITKKVTMKSDAGGEADQDALIEGAVRAATATVLQKIPDLAQ
jgi:hypothetical protein